MNPPPLVMIVEDDPVGTRIIVEQLQRSGLRTMVAATGREAVTRATAHKPDLILLDVLMPGIDGFETCRRLKAQPTTMEIPVIFMTSLSDTEDKIRGFDAGAVDYVTKPFQRREVLARVSTHLTLQRQRNELARLNAMKNKLLSIVALDMQHMFDTLLRPTRMLVDSAGDFTPQEIETFARRLFQAAKRAYEVLENLQLWANLQMGDIQARPEPLVLEDIVDELFQNASETADQKNITLSRNLPPDLSIYGDRDMVNRALGILVHNGLKYTKPGGRLSISAHRSENTVTVAVADTGIGMKPAEVRRLFQIERNRKPEGTAGETGNGIGLILCKELIEIIGGSISVESEIGKGTAVRVILRAAEPAPEETGCGPGAES